MEPAIRCGLTSPPCLPVVLGHGQFPLIWFLTMALDGQTQCWQVTVPARGPRCGQMHSRMGRQTVPGLFGEDCFTKSICQRRARGLCPSILFCLCWRRVFGRGESKEKPAHPIFPGYEKTKGIPVSPHQAGCCTLGEQMSISLFLSTIQQDGDGFICCWQKLIVRAWL